MSSEHQTVRDIYFTSWQYVRIGGFNLSELSSAGSGVSWQCSTGMAYDDRGTPTVTRRTVQEGKLSASDLANVEQSIRHMSFAPYGVRLVAQKPSKVRFSDRLGMPAEGWPGPITILADDGKYKCWYPHIPDARPDQRSEEAYKHGFNQYLRYAESDDGFNWTEPELGLVEHDGSKRNNIVLSPYLENGWFRGRFGAGVFVDRHGDPAERYKMAYFAKFAEDEAAAFMRNHPGNEDIMGFDGGYWGKKTGLAWGIAGAVSPDGIHWKYLDEPMLIAHSDTTINATFDPIVGKYVCYTRMWPRSGDSPESPGVVGRRSIGRMISDDFRNWSKSELVLAAGAAELPSNVYYNTGHTWLPGCDNQQVLFVNRWKQFDDTMDLNLFSTSDGWTWSAVPGGESIVSTGEVGTWEAGKIYGGAQLVELPGDKWALPYQGAPVPHKYPRINPDKRKLHNGVKADRGYAIWPKGRLVAMECPGEGSFATIAIVPAGQKLFLNAQVQPAGYIKVGLRTLSINRDRMADSNPVPGRAIEDCDVIWGANDLEIPVTWKGQDQMGTNGLPVVVIFEMRGTKLFGLSFR